MEEHVDHGPERDAAAADGQAEEAGEYQQCGEDEQPARAAPA
jgi:hypothetical protein